MGADALTFFRAWLSDPLKIASVIPSGDQLATLMTRHIEPGQGPVLELGAGTGVFTRALIKRGVRPEDVTLVEMSTEFTEMLSARFPGATIISRDASFLSRIPAGAMRPHSAAISGLPILTMPQRSVLRILVGTFRMLETGASLYQFTYGLKCPISQRVLDRLGLRVHKVGTVFANVPPASVYRISRDLSPG